MLGPPPIGRCFNVDVVDIEVVFFNCSQQLLGSFKAMSHYNDLRNDIVNDAMSTIEFDCNDIVVVQCVLFISMNMST